MKFFCFLFIVLISFSMTSQHQKYTKVVKLMGSRFDISVVAENEYEGNEYIELAIAEITRIEMPVQRPTSCAFGGPDMDVLYITSAEKKEDPLGGSLFVAHPKVKGPKANFYIK